MMRKLCGLQALAVGIALCPILCSAQAGNPTKQGAFTPTWEELSPVDPTKATTAQTNWENFIPDDPTKATKAQQAQPQRHGFHFDANGNPIDQVAGKVEPNPYDQFVNATQPASQSSEQKPWEVDWADQPGKKKASNFFADTLTPASGDKQTAPKIGTVEDGDLFKGGDPSQQAKLEKYHASKLPSAGTSLGIVFASVLLAFTCCYSIFWALGKSVQGSTPVATGRRWMNWAVLLALLQPLTKTFSLWLNNTGNPGDALAIGVLGVVVFGIAAFAFGALWAYFRHRKPSVGPTQKTRPDPPLNPDVQLATPDTETNNFISQTIDEAIWEAALAEFDSDNRRLGLWAMVFSAADGNESLAKARYLRARVTELEAEREALASQHALDARCKAKELELAHLTEEERAEALRPKGMCPNCDAVIALASATCPRCRFTFGNGTSWKIVPMPHLSTRSSRQIA